MSYFKDTNSGLHFIDDDSFENLLPSGCVKISNDEAKEINIANNPPPDTQVEINATAKDYLSLTDWYVIRFIETGVVIPDEVIKQRELARVSIK